MIGFLPGVVRRWTTDNATGLSWVCAPTASWYWEGNCSQKWGEWVFKKRLEKRKNQFWVQFCCKQMVPLPFALSFIEFIGFCYTPLLWWCLGFRVCTCVFSATKIAFVCWVIDEALWLGVVLTCLLCFLWKLHVDSKFNPCIIPWARLFHIGATTGSRETITTPWWDSG